MRNLTREEDLKTFEKHNQLSDVYNTDGSLKLMSIDLESVEIKEMVNGYEHVTEQWGKDNQVLLGI